MSATIVDILEYRKKNTPTEKMTDDPLIGSGEVYIELHIPPTVNENISPSPNTTDRPATSKYKSDLREDFARLEKIIIRALRNMELRMTIKIAIMCMISIAITSLLIVMAL